MLQRNSALHRIDALISRKFGEIDSKTRGARHRLRLARIFGDFLRYRARPERQHFRETPQVAQSPQGRPRGFRFRHSVTHASKICLCLSSFFHLCLMKTFVHLDFPLPTSLAPRHVCISKLLVGSPLLPSAVIGSFLSQANAMHPLKIGRITST